MIFFLIGLISFASGTLGLLFFNDFFVLTGFEENLYNIEYVFLEQSIQIIRVIFQLFFVLLIFVSFAIFVWAKFLSLWKVFLDFRRFKNLLNTEFVLLKIVIPKGFNKTPSSMESFFNTLHDNTGGVLGLLNKHLKGKNPPLYSFEIVSMGGNVSFYIRTTTKQLTALKRGLFANMPNLLIYEVSDYVEKFDYDKRGYKIDASEWTMGKNNYLPLKTYINLKKEEQLFESNHQISQDNKPESKDQLHELYEFFSLINEKETVCMQFVLRKHGDGSYKQRKNNSFFSKEFWEFEKHEDLAEKEIAEIISPKNNDENKNISQHKKDLVEDIERKKHKSFFDVGIRIIYFAPKNHFRNDIGGLILNTFSVFKSKLNNIKRSDFLLSNKLTGVEQKLGKLDFGFIKRKHLDNLNFELYNLYKDRIFFLGDVFWEEILKNKRHSSILLSTEELASMYHFPYTEVDIFSKKDSTSKIINAPKNIPR